MKDNLLQDELQYIFEPEAIKELQSVAKIESFKTDEILIDIGQPMNHVAIVLEGTIKVSTENENGDDLFLYYLETGETCAISLHCFTARVNNKVRAVAETDGVIAFIPSDKLDVWISKYPSWRKFIIENYNNRLNEMIKAIDNLAFNNMEERLTAYLKNKVWANNSKELRTSHADIARDLNSSRVVISRIMKKLEKDGLIQQFRNRVIVNEIN